MTSIQPILLCGGMGSRLWPLSQPPKQFQKIFNNNTMLQSTLFRLHEGYNSPIITTNIAYKSLIIEELNFTDLQKSTIILELTQIGTAASILVAIANCHEDTMAVVLPTDHYVENTIDFQKCLERAITVAKSNNAIVTIGRKPNYFNSRFGCIKAIHNDTTGYYNIEEFIEKPLNVPSGEYFWNLGIFIFKAKYYFSEIAKLAPNIFERCMEGRKNSITQKYLVYLKEENFTQIYPVSFDYMIMQKTKKALMVEATFDWIDVGTWNGILMIVNRLIKNYLNSSNNTEHPVLQYMKDVISDNSVSCEEKIIKPWGFYSVIAKKENFLVKYLHVNSKSATSMQLHKHRDEYYIKLSGAACVTVNTKVSTVNKNSVIKVPRLSIHRIENKNNSDPLQIIEIQIGDHISEDDIIRLFDVYGRV